jgi:anti-anti-sigma factor
MTDATMTVDHDGTDTARITLAGEIDMDNARQVETGLLGAISNQFTGVTLDLSGIEYIDSAGLRVLFALGSRLDTLQIALRLLVPEHSPVRRVIDLSGMAATIPVQSS